MGRLPKCVPWHRQAPAAFGDVWVEVHTLSLVLVPAAACQTVVDAK